MEILVDNSSYKRLRSRCSGQGSNPYKRNKLLDFAILPRPIAVSFVFENVLDNK